MSKLRSRRRGPVMALAGGSEGHQHRMTDERNGERNEDFERDYEPLVDRLRNLKWPEVSDETRERCWNEFQKMMTERGIGPWAEASGDS